MLRRACLLMALFVVGGAARGVDLDVGIAGHAFDHLGEFSDQGETAAASGATIIYTSGFGGMGYSGMLPEAERRQLGKVFSEYVARSRKAGIRQVIGYVCATSIVGLDRFDRNWPAEFRAQFKHPPAEWLQEDKDGKPLPSWYGGEYRPACMNNPDWRAYEKAIVRMQIEAGCDGIFFDNPTVHPQGCYCDHCMERFGEFLRAGKNSDAPAAEATLRELRKVALAHPVDFRRFRATIARDFMAEMRTFARSIKPAALITCNNSLNSSGAWFKQIQTYGYDIHEMSKTEDFVVVEDMESQPRRLANGTLVEYAPTYELLRAVSHGKPVVAVTIADGDYHTPGNLARLAMAEAAAHGASYLSWPTWPVPVRARLAASLKEEADVLRQNASLLNKAKPRADVLLFFPWRQWIASSDCKAAKTAAALSAANVQFEAVCEDDLVQRLEGTVNIPRPVLLIESRNILSEPERTAVERFEKAGGKVVAQDQKDWFKRFGDSSITMRGPAGIKVVVCDQPGRTIVHVLNLNVQKLSSFEDRVTPVEDVELTVQIPFGAARQVTAISADDGATKGTVAFEDAGRNRVKVKLAKTVVATILVIGQ